MGSECPYCDSGDVDYTVGFAEGLCGDCGFVLRENEDEQLEQPRKQVRASEILQESSVSDWREEVTVKDSSDEILVRLIHKTETLGEAMHLESTAIESAITIATEAWVEGLTHGRSLEVVAAIAVHVGANDCDYALPSSVLADRANVEKSTLIRSKRKVTSELEADLNPTRPQDYLAFISTELDIENQYAEAAASRLDKLEKLPSGNPSGIAAAALYQQLESSETDVTYRGMADTVNLTKETVWARAKDLNRLSC